MALRISRRGYVMVRPNRFGLGRKGSISFHSRSLRSLLYPFLVLIACLSGPSGVRARTDCRDHAWEGNVSLALVPLSVGTGLETAATDRHRAPCCRAILRSVIEGPVARVIPTSFQPCPTSIHHRNEHKCEHLTNGSIDTRTAGLQVCLSILVELHDEGDASSETVKHLGCILIHFNSIVCEQKNTKRLPEILYALEVCLSHGLVSMQKMVFSEPGA